MSEPQAEKKSSCLAIGGVGCLIIVILVVAGAGLLWWKAGPWLSEKWSEIQKDPERAKATMPLQMSPDIEIIKVDDEKRTVTFKFKSTGEEITATFTALANSRITHINGKTEIHGLERLTPDAAGATTPPATTPPPPPAPPSSGVPKQE